MGWSCLANQSKTLNKIHAWERTQVGYEQGTSGYFFEARELGGHDFGTAEEPNLTLEIYELLGHGKAQRRGSLEILPTGKIRNRSSVELPVEAWEA